jgi:hypothetical protein
MNTSIGSATLLKGIIMVGLVAALVLSGCASMGRQEAVATEQLLAAVGFQMRLADTPERLAALREMPPRKIVARTQDGETKYTYADAADCRCLYVGGPNEYAAYQGLARERNVSSELDSGSVNWLLWAPW